MSGLGEQDLPASGIVVASDGGWGAEADGFFRNALFVGSGDSPIGSGGTSLGTLWVDAAGNWWAATESSNDGGWRKIAGHLGAGQLHLLPTPVRVYDSRPGGAGFATAWPQGAWPGTSNINFTAGATVRRISIASTKPWSVTRFRS